MDKNELMDEILNKQFPQFFSILGDLESKISANIDSPKVELILNQLQYFKTKVDFIFQKSKLILFPHLRDNNQKQKNIHLLAQLNNDFEKILTKLSSFNLDFKSIPNYSLFADDMDNLYRVGKENLKLKKQLYSLF